MIFEWLYQLNIAILFPATIILIVGAAELGNWIGVRHRAAEAESADLGTLTGAALGLLALLLAFSFSISLARFDARRDVVLEEANAIGSTANFALMLPEPAQAPILGLLREYVTIRVTLGVPYDPAKTERDIARSVDLQGRLWRQAVAASDAAPQSLAVHRFVASLNEVNNIHEKRVSALRYHVPTVVIFTLVGVAMVALGFTGYNAGVSGIRRHMAHLIMSLIVSVLIMLIVDLDRPSRGLIHVPVQALVDAQQGIRPSL